jgi:hypothetical protein
MLIAAPVLAYAQVLPDVDLRDPDGQKIAQASVRLSDHQCNVSMKKNSLGAGKYRFVLNRVKKGGTAADPIAESPAFEVAQGDSKAVDVSIKVDENRITIDRYVANKELELGVRPEIATRPAAVGRILRWFSPWRDTRGR